jgi:hypothetical protein
MYFFRQGTKMCPTTAKPSEIEGFLLKIWRNMEGFPWAVQIGIMEKQNLLLSFEAGKNPEGATFLAGRNSYSLLWKNSAPLKKIRLKLSLKGIAGMFFPPALNLCQAKIHWTTGKITYSSPPFYLSFPSAALP